MDRQQLTPSSTLCEKRVLIAMLFGPSILNMFLRSKVESDVLLCQGPFESCLRFSTLAGCVWLDDRLHWTLFPRMLTLVFCMAGVIGITKRWVCIAAYAATRHSTGEQRFLFTALSRSFCFRPKDPPFTVWAYCAMGIETRGSSELLVKRGSKQAF